jgi:transcriptional regulator with XRE-family HTH domain
MQTVRAGSPIPITATARVQAGLRLRAARLIADISLRDSARSARLTFAQVNAIEHGREPLTSIDDRDLGAVLDCPADWLIRGWSS